MKKWIVSVVSALAVLCTGLGIAIKKAERVQKRDRALSDKHLALFLMMNQWVKVRQKGKNIETYFQKNDYKRIAIYGMSYVGETLWDELKNTDIEVVYGIDRNADYMYSELPVVSIEDDLEKVDAIVVTAITFFKDIKGVLVKKVDCPIISLENILEDIANG